MSRNQLSTFVLVVADRLAARAELMAALAPVTSTRVTEAASVAEAIADLQPADVRTDAAVIDLEMAGSGAVTLIRKIREAQTLGPRNIAVLLIGGSTNTPHYHAACRLGVQGYMPRPFTDAQLHAALRAALIARPTQAVTRAPQAAPRQPSKAAPPPKPSAPYEQRPDAVPVANKPFRHGLQSLMRKVVPLTSEDGFGFEPPPVARLPLQRIQPEMPIMVRRLRIAVA